tara:strand:- start:206 stop:1024 length:819 start_codon:yes stop_codon:yes gene_type:complete
MPDKKYKKNWLVEIFTLGDRFSWKSFFDRVKKSGVEFFVVVFGILISLGIEKQGGQFDQRNDNIENIKSITEEVKTIKSYTEEYLEENEWVTDWFQQQYDRWEIDNDSIFIEFYEDSTFSIPMAMYYSHNPFNPRRVVFDAIKLDGTFRLLEKGLGRMVSNTYDGVDLNYLIRNTDVFEQENIKEFKNRITNVWAMDLDNIDTETVEFWIQNREYIQRDRVMKHILFSRIQNWITIRGQLQAYNTLLEKSIVNLEKAQKAKDEETVFIWWWF